MFRPFVLFSVSQIISNFGQLVDLYQPVENEDALAQHVDDPTRYCYEHWCNRRRRRRVGRLCWRTTPSRLSCVSNL